MGCGEHVCDLMRQVKCILEWNSGPNGRELQLCDIVALKRHSVLARDHLSSMVSEQAAGAVARCSPSKSIGSYAWPRKSRLNVSMVPHLRRSRTFHLSAGACG